MKKFGWFVLVSYNKACFRKCVYYLPKEDTTIVINTMDSDMESELIDTCNELGFKYVITESDGTPATGKNSMVRLFLESELDYCVMVDGDDFITPYGVKLYSGLPKLKEPPDILCIYRQTSLKILKPEMFTEETRRSDIWGYGLQYPTDKSDPNVHNMTAEYMSDWFQKQFKVDPETAMRWGKARANYNAFLNAYSDNYEYMLRMVFFSRHAAEMLWYDPAITIGEDTIQWLKLKHEALVNGSLNMVKLHDRDRPTYIQNREEPGICMQLHPHNWDWMEPFLEETKKITLPPPNTELPELHISMT
jgi:hypothetical protein